MLWLLLLNFFSFQSFAKSVNGDRLRYVAVLFRHGERGPLYNFSSDETRNYFRNKTGQLTEKGKQQASEFGAYLKKRFYDGRSDIITRIHSPNMSRCLESGKQVLKAIFPDTNSTATKPNIKLFAENKTDWVLQLPIYECPRQVKALKKRCPHLKNAIEYVKYDDFEAELMRCTEVFKNSKYFNKFSHIQHVETLVAEVDAGLSERTELSIEAEKIMQATHELSEGYGEYMNDVVARTSTGQLISILYNELLDEQNGTLIHLVSTQDWIIASSMQVLGISDLLNHQNPPYMSSLILESWSDGEKGKVKMYYQMLNETGTTPAKEMSRNDFAKNFAFLKEFDVKKYCKSER